MSIKNNPPRRTALVCTVITILVIITIFIPGIIGMDGFDGGFALSFGAGFLAIMGIITVVIYSRLAGRLDHILRQENSLAHWHYSPEEWREYTQTEFIEDKSAKKGIFILIAVITVIVGIVLAIINRDDALLIIAITIGFILFMGLVAFISITYIHWQNRKYHGEAYLTRDGVYLNRQLHIWKGIGTRLEDAIYEDENSAQPRIVFQYSAPGTSSRYYYTARIPVPHGEEGNARKIVAEIVKAHLTQNNT